MSALAAAAEAGPYGGDHSDVRWDDPRIVGWAAACLEIVQPNPASGGYAHNDAGQVCAASNAVLGRPAGFVGAQTQHVLSLGNGGSITLSFEYPLEDRPGPDFAVFENGFTSATDWTGTMREGSTNTYTFAELAFVEVASRTTAWARFPATCLNTSVLYALDNLDANRFACQDVTLLDGLAGKHVIEYGTPCDLDALTNDPAVVSGAVDLRNVRYVRLVDVIGDGSTTDREGRPVYDPFYNHQVGYPEAAPLSSTDGFDPRGIAVIHFAGVSISAAPQGMRVSWYAATGFAYQVQSWSGPGAAWSNVGAVVAGDNTERSVVESAGGSFRMYRVLGEEMGGL